MAAPTATAPPPHPRANPLLGSALDLRRSQIRTYERVMREVGDVVRLTAGPPGMRIDLYCVFHPDGVQRVLAGSREGYTKGNRFYSEIARLNVYRLSCGKTESSTFPAWSTSSRARRAGR